MLRLQRRKQKNVKTSEVLFVLSRWILQNAELLIFSFYASFFPVYFSFQFMSAVVDIFGLMD